MSRSPVADMVRDGGAAAASAARQMGRGEMRRRVEALAADLRAAGVGDAVPVGVSLEPSPDLAIAVLAVLRAGAPVVPLDPSYPAARLGLMSAAAGLRLVLCDGAGEAALAEAAPGVELVRAGGRDALRSARPEPVPGLDGCAYVLFTSGSTGVPKGVTMPASGIARLVEWQTGTHPAGPGARTLQFAASSFDVFFQELLCTWHEGGELVVPGAGEKRDAFRLARRLAAAGVARLFLPFVALQQLAVAVTADAAELPALRQVVTAGEQLQATEPVRELFRAHPVARLFNQYGPTETHVATELALDADPDVWDRLPSIGRPLPYVHARVDPSDDGEPGGELVLGGACVARGYLGQPEMTAERFSTDASGERWYRTGDRVEERADGTMRFLGRLDDQVKVRGFRVELGEVEAVLSSHPDVAAAVAFVQESASGGRTLAAAVQPRPGRDITAAGIREHVRERVPEQFVPARVEVAGELPRTPSGKLDRRALARRRAGGPPSAGSVAAVLCEALSAELGFAVTEDDALLDVGADSLAAMVAIGRVREELGVELTVDELVDAESIAAAARGAGALAGGVA